MKRTVFISSTYRDLKKHREKIWNVLQNLDINITGMEEFGARQSTPLETCIEELEQSDIYIGIISMCYGSVDSLTGKSYTQLEYEKAKDLNLDILIYLIDENSGQITTGNIDFGDNYLSLKNFKRILNANHTVDWFNNEEDLSGKIFKRLSKILPSTGSVTKRPYSLNARVFNVELGSKNWSVFVGYQNSNPYEIFSALRDDEFGVLIPRSVEKGAILKSKTEDGVPRFDFQYINKRGYKTTIENIDYSFHPQIKTYDKIVTELLNDGSLSQAIKVLKHMELGDADITKWNQKIVNILKQ
jgi:hypothetical protein